ncbi:MAG: UvrB/UvrC motif-containing protein [Clostridia bacterium]|nr:UvrB/UvrC motif-containing protein [Clostridia bacterium]
MDLFSEFFNEIWNDFNVIATPVQAREEQRCKVCGHTVSDFRKSGRFGCGECYNTFRQFAQTALKQIHSTSAHCGKIPSKSGEELRKKRKIDELKKELSAAVKAEDYEKAALLHKQIKGMSE